MDLLISSKRLLTISTLFAAVLFAGLWAVRTHALWPDYAPLIVTDFINDWVAAHLARDGQLAMLFDDGLYNDIMETLWGGPVEFHNWSYPLHLLPLLIPFAALSYFQALFVWTMLGLLAYLWAARHAVPKAWLWVAVVSPACLVNIAHGQTGFFCAALFVGGLLSLAKRPWFAGVLFGLLTLKPHLGILVLPVLLIRGEWRAMISASLTSFFLIGISIVLWGFEPWVAFFETTCAAQVHLLDQFSGFYRFLMPGIIAGARGLSISIEAAWILFALISVPVAVAVLVMVRREGITPRTLLALSLGTVLVIPYAFNYDMTIISLSLVAYLCSGGRVSLLWVFIWISPVVIYYLAMLHVPLVPVALLCGVAHLYRESCESRIRHEK